MTLLKNKFKRFSASEFPTPGHPGLEDFHIRIAYRLSKDSLQVIQKKVKYVFKAIYVSVISYQSSVIQIICAFLARVQIHVWMQY